MKILRNMVLAVVAVGSCAAASAQYTDQADMDRRARNREEAIANHERMQRSGTPQRNSAYSQDRMQPRSGTPQRNSADSQDRMQPRSDSARERVRDGARSTRNFTHRQLEKMRNFSDRQNAKYPASSRPAVETNKSAPALGK